MATDTKLTGCARDLHNLKLALEVCRNLVDFEMSKDGFCHYCHRTLHSGHPFCPVKKAQEALDY